MTLHTKLATVAGLLAASASLSWGSPSGLNNIPTADTTPQGTVVLQGWSTMGGGLDEDFNLGFKSGVSLGPVKLEFGLDSHILPDKGGPVTFQGKLAVPFGENLPTLAVGVANTAFSGSWADRTGDPFAYVVLSHDFGFLRAHAGCGTQNEEALPFFGLDKTFRITTGTAAAAPAVVSSGKQSVPVATAAVVETTRDLFTLRADGIMQRDDSWLYSAGVLVPVCKHIVLETWGNFPDSGEDASVTVKLNVVLNF